MASRQYRAGLEEAEARIARAALTEAESLSLVGLHLAEVPDSVGELRGLRALFLGRNELTALPDSLRGLTSLKSLSVAENRLRTLPGWLSRLGLNGLTIDGNPLGHLPAFLRDIKSLLCLEAGDIGLETVPAFLCEMTGLNMLSLAKNGLTSLPDGMRQLNELFWLDLNDNLLTEVPDCLVQMPHLSTLWIERNRLRSLPTGLTKLPRLRELKADGNPLDGLDPAIAEARTETVLDFLRSSESTGTSRNWRSRVLVVGEAAVGKTSLVRALTDLEHRPGEPSTHGMSVTRLPLAPPSGPSTLDLALWDFGGQPNYQACHQFFFSGRSLFLVVWDTRNGAERDRLVEWIETVAARAPDAPVLVVATHVDERAADLDPRIVQRHPQVVGVHAVDCAGERTGIKALREAIAEAAAGLPLMGAAWPTAWEQAARALREHPAPQITVADMRVLMRRAGVEEPAMAGLTGILHSLGDVLYPESAARRVIGDVVTLDPAWLNARISQILDWQAIQDRAGVLTRSDLEAMWPDLDHGTRDYLLAMTEEYDLSFPITDSADPEALALVVDRLARAEPDLSAWHAAGRDPAMRRIRIRYVPSHALPGIPAWFIAREYRFSSGRAWRKGVLLRDARNDDWALLRTSDDGTVELEVRGRYAPARFFGILDDGLHQTFDRYPGLDVVRRVPCPCQGIDAPDCPHGYREDVIQRRLAEGVGTISCSESGADVELADLLDGISPTRKALRSQDHPGAAALVREGDIMERIAAASAETTLRVLREQLQREFSRNRSIKQITCPSVVTLVPDRKRVGKTVYRLHLWCDQPGAWHELPAESGSYELSEPDQWLRTLSPHLQRVAKILRVTLPIGKAALGLAAHELAGHAHDQLKTWQNDLAHVPSKAPKFADSLRDFGAAGPDAGRIALLDSDYRVLEHALVTLDPGRKWGGLNRVETVEGQVFYLCDAHTREYDRRPVPLRPDGHE